jgi:D-lactate dehydrogenase
MASPQSDTGTVEKRAGILTQDTLSNVKLINTFRAIVGPSHVITNPTLHGALLQGVPVGGWHGARRRAARHAAGTMAGAASLSSPPTRIVIMQAANTGLTEGSTPNGTYDRDAVVISTNRMDRHCRCSAKDEQIISFPGATLFAGKAARAAGTAAPFGDRVVLHRRLDHRRGLQQFRRLADRTGAVLHGTVAFAQVTEDGALELVNHLGIDLGEDPETILTRLGSRDYTEADIETPTAKASDTEYRDRVRDVDAPSPARFNADKRRLHEGCGLRGQAGGVRGAARHLPQEL